jgi:very-short-patch-repair endonuclease
MLEPAGGGSHRALTAAGWTVLRFSYRQVMNRPEWVVATVRTTLELCGRGRRPSA